MRHEQVVALIALSSHRPNGFASLYGLSKAVGWEYDPFEFWDALHQLENLGRITSHPVAVASNFERELLMLVNGEYDAELAADMFEERRYVVTSPVRFRVHPQTLLDIQRGLRCTYAWTHRDYARMLEGLPV